ncbi:MAG: flagellar assembly protein A [Sulfuricellaceae bacterium]
MSTEPAATQPSPQQAATGETKRPKESQVALPPFFIKNAEGVFVDLLKLDSSASFHAVAERIFSANAYFSGLDYDAFSRLLYGFDPAEAQKLKKPTETAVLVRFASDIVVFRPERRTLYKSVKLANGLANYFFETPYREVETEEPVYGEGADGAYGLINVVKSTSLVPDKLNFDEFVADMWMKGVRYGIDQNAVKAAIDGGKSGFVAAARRLDVVLGKAADIQELAEEIRRDDAPARLADGRIDLSQFKNRFPQINKGAQLIKKIPLVLGKTGYDISGHPIKPPIPKDLNLANLAGPGTAVEIIDGDEFIVSQQDGFLSFDDKTNQISIVEKIVSRDGVSARTTGNLVLTGEQFEEHGEVQEKRTVEGNSITIHANVYGTILSRGGTILLKSNLVGGEAINEAGEVTVKGLASNATVQTKKGDVKLRRAENCVVIGTRVAIGMASNCTILADELIIQEALGCVIAAKGIKIDSVGANKQIETLIFPLVPDLSMFDRQINSLTTKISEIEPTLKKKNAEMEKATSDPEVRKYLLIASKLKKNEITLSKAQNSAFLNLTVMVTPMLKMASKLRTEVTALEARINTLTEQLNELAEIKKTAENGTYCTLGKITGETVVRAMSFGPEGDSFHGVPPKQLNTKMLGASALGEKIFSGKGGALNWKFVAPKSPDHK